MNRDFVILFEQDFHEISIYEYYSFHISNKKIVCVARDRMSSLRNANDVAFATDLKI